jgi:hypothetical protein
MQYDALFRINIRNPSHLLLPVIPADRSSDPKV